MEAERWAELGNSNFFLTPVFQLACFPEEVVHNMKRVGWCPVCVPDAKKGEPGYCEPEWSNQDYVSLN